jgi:hypothetical protein
MALKNLYARVVLRLIAPSLRLANRDSACAKSIGWVIRKDGSVSIIRTTAEAAQIQMETVAALSASLARHVDHELRWRRDFDAK